MVYAKNSDLHFLPLYTHTHINNRLKLFFQFIVKNYVKRNKSSRERRKLQESVMTRLKVGSLFPQTASAGYSFSAHWVYLT